jgi:hypothetical protein
MTATTFKVGDRVRLVKAARHNMIEAGAVGVVVEITTDGVIPGVSVEFMRVPDARIARMFGKPVGMPEPFRCRFPFGRTTPLTPA